MNNPIHFIGTLSLLVGFQLAVLGQEFTDHLSSGANWSSDLWSSGNAATTFANGRLEFTTSVAPSATVSAGRNLTIANAPYTSDWSVQVDAHLFLTASQYVTIGLVVVNSSDLSLPFERWHLFGANLVYDGAWNVFISNFVFNNTVGNGAMNTNGVVDGTLRISFNSTTKELSAWCGPRGAATRLLQTVDIDDGGWSFNMSPGDTFSVVLRGTDNYQPVASGAVYWSNFQATGLPAPRISGQPQSQSVVAGQNVSFSVTGVDPAPLGYRWQVSTDGGGTWTNLTDTMPYSGTATRTLTITGATTALNGYQYGCVATYPTGAITTSPATLVVYAPLRIVTLAGLPGSRGSADGSGSAARFAHPADAATDAAGNLYIADTGNHTIRKITPAGVATTLAGQDGSSGSSDGSSAARFNHPSGVAVDSAGNVYVADTDNNAIRRVTTAGVVTTLAGLAGSSGTADGSGSTARFNGPSGIVVNATGNLYVADTLNHTIRRIITTGVVSTIAGVAGESGFADSYGSFARFYGPQGLALDASGNLLVADTNNNAIRRIVTGSGVVTTVAGWAGTAGSTDGANSQAQFRYPSGVAVDSAGNIFVADTDNHALREIVPSGAVRTLAGLAGSSGSADGVGTAARFAFPTGVAVNSSGDVYVADTNNDTIRLGIHPAAPIITAQPQSQSVTAGYNVQFSVTATGEPTPTYQWNLYGVAISGATSSFLSLNNVQAASAGDYTVTVSNTYGSVTSNNATLTVNTPAPPPSSGGGGGGGAPSLWFYGALSLLMAIRKSFRRK